MPGPWNDATDRQLLLTIVHLAAPQLPKWDQVAELMGEGFTAESTRQHFQKLRRDCKAQFGEPGDAGTASPAKGTTPRKPKPAASGTTPGKSTGKRKGKKDAAAGDDADEESPTKKVKVEGEEDHGLELS